MVMMRTLSIILVALAFSAADGARGGEEPSETADRPLVLEVHLENQAISPITARIIDRAVTQAEQESAACLILVLDTPGGLVESTRTVVQRILASDVPVVVYVAPSGARAASAGVFVTLASHVAAMAPATHIGAAHPVQIGGWPGSAPQNRKEGDAEGESPSVSPREIKTVNDTVAWARALAQLRDRNAEWAALAVRESVSVPATEAIEEGVVELIADDLDELLVKLDGREVQMPSGTVQIHTAGAERRQLPIWWGERLLATLTNPNVAFLLLIFGFYGILFELYSPGWGVAGTLGIVCLLMGLVSLAVLPINYVGLALVAVALALFVAEAFVVSYGALTIAGAVCLVLGALMLVDSPAGFQRVSWAVALPVALATASIAFFLIGGIVRAHRGAVQTGSEGLLGAHAVADEDFMAHETEYAGHVRTSGEIWSAVSHEPIHAGQTVEVRGRDGLTLSVQPAATDRGPSVGGPA